MIEVQFKKSHIGEKKGQDHKSTQFLNDNVIDIAEYIGTVPLTIDKTFLALSCR